MTFAKFCSSHAGDSTDVGDFCRDWVQDDCRPIEPRSWEDIEDHLVYSHAACYEALEAAREAWELFHATKL